MNKLIDEVYDIITNGDIGFNFKNTNISILQNEIEIKGDIQFNQKYKDIQLQDKYLIQILFPLNFPSEIPIVREMEGRIESSADYHNNKENNGFCLGVPGEIHKKIHGNPTVKYFISEIVIPFLYANTFREKYKKYPWPTREHYSKGLLKYYQNEFDLKDENITKNFLLNLAYLKNNAKGHIQCPCGSGTRFRNCHGSVYRKLITYHSHKDIQKDVLCILKDEHVPNIDKVLKEKIYTKKWYKLYRTCLISMFQCAKIK